jgi:hypothetical protein
MIGLRLPYIVLRQESTNTLSKEFYRTELAIAMFAIVEAVALGGILAGEILINPVHAKNGTGCGLNSTGFFSSNGKYFHHQNHNK